MIVRSARARLAFSASTAIVTPSTASVRNAKNRIRLFLAEGFDGVEPRATGRSAPVRRARKRALSFGARRLSKAERHTV